MQRVMLSGKIHRARVTEKSVDYEGSIAVDRDLLERAGIAEYEKVLVANISNGSRVETYAIGGARGSGQVCLNGATARLGEVGDLVIIMSFAVASEEEIRKGWKPKVVAVGPDNKPARDG